MLRHGENGPSKQGYRRGCRCDECLVFGEVYRAERRAREIERRANPPDPETITTHGRSGYQRGCRCAECVRDTKEAKQARQPDNDPLPDWSELGHLLPGAGVRRRG